MGLGSFCFCGISTPTSHAVDVTELVGRARKLGLSKERLWHRLLYYRARWFSSESSIIDDAAFFLSSKGNRSPEEELEADLRSFFRPQREYAIDLHPRCLFPARFEWLADKLDINVSQLSPVSCPALEGWFEKISPKKVSFVFSSGYLNNPASMFGHTFLRIHRHNSTSGDAHYLLDVSVSYAATPFTLNPLIYPVLGLAGGFDGRFAVTPYYFKIQEYNNYEMRDLTEYELAIGPPQVRRMVLSLWEIWPRSIKYFYLDENCATLPLMLLEVADPELALSDRFKIWVVPSDVVQKIAMQTKMVRKKSFRPSSLRVFMARYSLLNAYEKSLTKQIVDSNEPYPMPRLAGVSPEIQSRVIDAALDYIDYKERLAGIIQPKDFLGLRKQLIEERSKIPVLPAKADETEMANELSDPGKGHGSAKVGFGVEGTVLGIANRFEFRPALHDIGSVSRGFSDDLEIRFFDTAMKYFWGHHHLKLVQLNLFDILSVPPIQPLIVPISWRLKLGWEEDGYCGEDRVCMKKAIGGGSGFTSHLGMKGLLAYWMAMAEVGGSDRQRQSFFVAPGSNIGSRYELSENIVWRAEASASYRFASVRGWVWGVRTSVSYALRPQIELRTIGEWNHSGAMGGGYFYTYF